MTQRQVKKIKIFTQGTKEELEKEINESLEKDFFYPLSENVITVDIKIHGIGYGYTWVGVILYNEVIGEKS